MNNYESYTYNSSHYNSMNSIYEIQEINKQINKMPLDNYNYRRKSQ